jgi:hypothetical protein
VTQASNTTDADIIDATMKQSEEGEEEGSHPVALQCVDALLQYMGHQSFDINDNIMQENFKLL